MGRVKSFKLTLENSNAVYYPGDEVSGSVNIDVKTTTKIRQLVVNMRGLVQVHWTESRSTGTRLGSYTEHFNAEIEYFHFRQTLFDAGRDDNVLEEGRHQYPFRFTLPDQGIATSFEGKHGSIRYWMKAELMRPLAFSLRCKKAFTVICPIDINRSEYLAPSEAQVSKSVCCFALRSGPVTILARTDRRGFCPGESVSISAEFENFSTRRMVPYATLHQVETCFARGSSRQRDTKLTTLTGLPIPPGARAQWENQPLKVPAVSPSVYNCSVIRVHYYVKLSLHIPLSASLSLRLPVVVGTVPFRYSSRPLSQPRSVTDLLVGAASNLTLMVPPPYSEAMTPPPPFGEPPTYMESCQGGGEMSDDEVEFTDLENRSMHTSQIFTPVYRYVFAANDNEPPPAYTSQATIFRSSDSVPRETPL